MAPAASRFCRRPQSLAITLALIGALALGATTGGAEARDRSTESAGTLSDNAAAANTEIVAPTTSSPGKTIQRGTVRVETPVLTDSTETAATPVQTGPAQMIFIDPETGELTSSPPPDAQRALQRLSDPALNTSAEGLEFVTHPDGSVSVDLQGRFQSRVFVIKDETGNMKLSHQPSASSRTIPSPTHSDHPSHNE